MTLDPRTLLTRALEAQAFRGVPLNELVAAPFHLPGSSGQVDAALTRIKADPNWVEVVRQLAQLQTKAFSGMHLRLDTHDLEIVVVYAWSGNVGPALVDQYMDFVQTVTNQLEGKLGEFRLQEPAVEALTVVQDLAGVGDLAKKTATLMLELNKATMPNTNVIFLDTDGVSDELVAKFNPYVQRTSVNPFSFNRPWSFGLAIDGRTLAVYGSNDIFTLNIDELRRSLSFLSTHG